MFLVFSFKHYLKIVVFINFYLYKYNGGALRYARDDVELPYSL
jgi:hypothetical protein